MRCDRCGKNEATFYYKSNINGKVTQVHLCHQCAEELGYTDSFRSAGMTGGLFGDFFSRPFGMLEPFFSGLAPACSPSSLNRWMCWAGAGEHTGPGGHQRPAAQGRAGRPDPAAQAQRAADPAESGSAGGTLRGSGQAAG